MLSTGHVLKLMFLYYIYQCKFTPAETEGSCTTIASTNVKVFTRRKVYEGSGSGSFGGITLFSVL